MSEEVFRTKHHGPKRGRSSSTASDVGVSLMAIQRRLLHLEGEITHMQRLIGAQQEQIRKLNSSAARQGDAVKLYGRPL